METTVTTIYWGILYMVHYPEVQRQLQLEIDLILDTAAVNWANRNAMHYMRATLDELQRIVNILPWHIPHQTSAEVGLEIILKISLGGSVRFQDSQEHDNYASIRCSALRCGYFSGSGNF